MHFLNVARGSAAEVTYLVDLARELAYLSGPVFKELNDRCEAICRQVEALLQSMELLLLEEEEKKRSRRRTKARNATNEG